MSFNQNPSTPSGQAAGPFKARLEDRYQKEQEDKKKGGQSSQNPLSKSE